MDCKTSILEVEARLGFNFKRGLSREHRAKQTNETNHLLERIHEINEAYSQFTWKDIRSSEAIRSEAEELFDDLGPTLWPGFDKINGPFPSWLFRPDRPRADENPHHDLYPRPLFFSNSIDNTLLSQHFYALICLKIFGYATNHSWRNSLLATSDERDSQNYIVRDVDSDFSDYTDNSAHNAEDHAEIDIDGDQTDDVVALNKSASEKSYLSSLEPTPEPLNSMSMHPAAPVACMVPKKPPMGNTQAKLAAFRNDDNTALGSHIITGQFQTQYATSSKGQGEWHNSTPAEFAMQEIDDTLSSSAQGYLDPSPQPRPKIRRLKLHSGKRAADDDNHVTSKRRKQMQTQMDVQGITPATGVQGTGQQLGPQGRSTLVLPLSSNLLAQFGTTTNNVLDQDRDSVPGRNITARSTSSDKIRTHLNEGDGETHGQGVDVHSSPLATGAINTDQNTRPGQEQTRPLRTDHSDTARNLPNDAVPTVVEMPANIEPAGDTIVVKGNAQTRSAGLRVSPNTQLETSSEPRESRTEPESGANVETGRPSLVLQSSGSLEAEMHQAITPSQLTGNVASEPDLQTPIEKLEPTLLATDKDTNALRSVFFRLYLDEEADPLEPQCCVKLTGLTTRDELFTMMQDDLQDDLDDGDRIVAVKIKRADGEIFRGPNVRTMPIKRVGQQGMWRELMNTLLEHGAGEQGLMGYIKVKKFVDAK